MSSRLPVFDRSFLSDSDFEFVVISDTHYMLNPEVYAVGPDAQDVEFARQWSARAEWALRLASSLQTSLVMHLGDLTQEYPKARDFARSRVEARAQLGRVGLRPHHVAGNMDIGDKPNLTVPAEWVTPRTLAEWHEQFGRSWYSFDSHGIHFVALNSQIVNGPLPEADEQKRWLESDLAEHANQRIFIFLHMPPFFVDEREPGLGHYNSMDEPAREWLLGLVRKHRVELVFSGHTHFAAVNRVGGTRLFVVPSATKSRGGGFNEVFSVCSLDRGRNDVAKLGFYLVRVQDHNVRIHLIRTHGETGPADNEGHARRLITRTSRDLPNSPLGVYSRLPFARTTNGIIAWPDAVRLRARDDYPFLGCLEIGARHLRVPLTDLQDDVQRTRLAMAKDEGIGLTGVWLWSDRTSLVETAKRYKDQLDAVEVQVPGTLWPGNECLETIAGCSRELAIPVTLAPLLASERAAGGFHPRGRTGYRVAELSELNRRLSQSGIRVNRVLCRVDHSAHSWDVVRGTIDLLPLGQIDNFDYIVELPGLDEGAQANRAAEGIFAAALLRGCRLFLDPLVDLDRTSDINYGLLDRLSNPRPAFHIVRCLNTILFSLLEEFQAIVARDVQSGRILGIRSTVRDAWLLLPKGRMSVGPEELDRFGIEKREFMYFDLAAGTSQVLAANGGNLGRPLSQLETPTLLVSTGMSRKADCTSPSHEWL